MLAWGQQDAHPRLLKVALPGHGPRGGTRRGGGGGGNAIRGLPGDVKGVDADKCPCIIANGKSSP